MKSRMLLLFIASNFYLLTSVAQSNGEHTSDKIVKAIRKGNYSELAKYFNRTIDLTIPGNEGTYSNSQAEMIIRNFFSNYKPKSFSIKEKGNSTPNSEYVIGEIVTDKAVFRTYWLLKHTSGKYYIQQLKFEKQ